jgi:hypothetical protein
VSESNKMKDVTTVLIHFQLQDARIILPPAPASGDDEKREVSFVASLGASCVATDVAAGSR